MICKKNTRGIVIVTLWVTAKYTTDHSACVLLVNAGPEHKRITELNASVDQLTATVVDDGRQIQVNGTCWQIDLCMKRLRRTLSQLDLGHMPLKNITHYKAIIYRLISLILISFLKQLTYPACHLPEHIVGQKKFTASWDFLKLSPNGWLV